jgi:hypothetical protein
MTRDVSFLIHYTLPFIATATCASIRKIQLLHIHMSSHPSKPLFPRNVHRGHAHATVGYLDKISMINSNVGKPTPSICASSAHRAHAHEFTPFQAPLPQSASHEDGVGTVTCRTWSGLASTMGRLPRPDVACRLQR